MQLSFTLSGTSELLRTFFDSPEYKIYNHSKTVPKYSVPKEKTPDLHNKTGFARGRLVSSLLEQGILNIL